MTVACPHRDDRSQAAARYLAQRDDAASRPAYEAHLFECADCARAAETAAEIRAAFVADRAAAAAEQAPARPWPFLRLAAALALVAVGGAGLWLWRERATGLPQDPRRGSEPELALAVARSTGPEGGIELTWQAVPGAARHLVQVYDAGGALLWETTASPPRSTLDAARLAAVPGASFVQLAALDELGQPVSESPLVPLPAAGFATPPPPPR